MVAALSNPGNRPVGPRLASSTPSCHDAPRMQVLSSLAKHRALQRLLAEHEVVQVVLDARRNGVEVPAGFAHDHQLRLNLSWHFGLPMEIDDQAVSATLTFDGARHPVRLPFCAIYLIVPKGSADARVFPQDLPAELLADTPAIPQDTDADLPLPPVASLPRRGHLRLVK